MSDRQWTDLLGLLTAFGTFEQFGIQEFGSPAALLTNDVSDRYHRSRPHVSVKEDPKAWWRFAGQV